jgi:hypothetical protein
VFAEGVADGAASIPDRDPRVGAPPLDAKGEDPYGSPMRALGSPRMTGVAPTGLRREVTCMLLKAACCAGMLGLSASIQAGDHIGRDLFHHGFSAEFGYAVGTVLDTTAGD